jgi:hypothetical protein
MCDDGKIGILTLCHSLWQFQLQTLLLFVVIVHTHSNFLFAAKIVKLIDTAKDWREKSHFSNDNGG